VADQPEIFFVASSGGAATKWLSNILSSVSEDVLCYHGADIRALSETPLKSGTDEDQKRIVKFQLDLAKRKNKVIGTVHAVYDDAARALCLDAGGRSAALIRDPFDRAISLSRTVIMANDGEHAMFTRSSDSPMAQTVYSIIGNLYQTHGLTTQDNRILASQFDYLLRLISIMANDIKNMNGFTREEIFRFEDYTTSDDVVRTLARLVLPERFHASAEKINPSDHAIQHNRAALISSSTVVAKLNQDFDFVTGSYEVVSGHLKERLGLDIEGLYLGYDYDLRASIDRVLSRGMKA
jgi:hypothetical protein